jgi:hypothetical protein
MQIFCFCSFMAHGPTLFFIVSLTCIGPLLDTRIWLFEALKVKEDTVLDLKIWVTYVCASSKRGDAANVLNVEQTMFAMPRLDCRASIAGRLLQRRLTHFGLGASFTGR